MKADFLLRLRLSDHFDQARTEPLRMGRFVSVLGNVTEPGFREVRIFNLWKPCDVRQPGAHHRTDHGPRCRYPVASKVLQQIGHANVMCPPGHPEQIIIKIKIECAPGELKIQADYTRWLGHFVSSARHITLAGGNFTRRQPVYEEFFPRQESVSVAAQPFDFNPSALSGRPSSRPLYRL